MAVNKQTEVERITKVIKNVFSYLFTLPVYDILYRSLLATRLRNQNDIKFLCLHSKK